MIIIPKIIIMIKLIFVINIIILIIFSLIKINLHPLTYIIILILYIINILLLINIEIHLNVYVYIIFISIVGGLIIIFIYFTRLINNYKIIIFKFELNSILLIVLIIIICIIYCYNNYIPINFIDKISFKRTIKSSIYSIYIFPNYIYLIISINYLIYCLILIIKISLIKFKSLRKIKN